MLAEHLWWYAGKCLADENPHERKVQLAQGSGLHPRDRSTRLPDGLWAERCAALFGGRVRGLSIFRVFPNFLYVASLETHSSTNHCASGFIVGDLVGSCSCWRGLGSAKVPADTSVGDAPTDFRFARGCFCSRSTCAQVTPD